MDRTISNLKKFIVSKLKNVYLKGNYNEVQNRKKEYEEVKVEFEKQEYVGKNPFKTLWQDMKNKGYTLKSKLRITYLSFVTIFPILANIISFSLFNFDFNHVAIFSILSVILISINFCLSFILYLIYKIIFEPSVDVKFVNKTDLTIDYENKKKKYEEMKKEEQRIIENIDTIFENTNVLNEVLKMEIFKEAIDGETYQYISQNLSQEELKKILSESFYHGEKNIYYSSIVEYIIKNESENYAEIISKKMKQNNFKIKEEEKETIFS
jgi:hypothetical protein